MKQLIAISLALFVAATPSSGAEPDQKSTIPLDQIWGYEMPKTKDLRELEGLNVPASASNNAYARSITRKIVGFLSSYVPGRSEKAEPAFVVVNRDKDALTNAWEVFKNRAMKEQTGALPKDTELSLVFFSYVTGWHLQINSVAQSSDSITVKYQFIAPQEPAFGAVRFALIPIGKLPQGTVRVKIEEVPPVDYAGRRVPSRNDSDRFVCGSFEFVVE